MFHNKKIAFCLLLASCTLICAAQIDAGAKTVVDDAVPIIAKLPDGDATVASPTPTPEPTTAKPSSTSTTAAPTTTTTTAKPSTTSAPVTTTTSGPTPTPTPAPVPFPEPEVGTWNASCIMIKMAAQLNFTYTTKDNKTKQGLYNIPKDAVVHQKVCDSNLTQTVELIWGPDASPQSFLMQFDAVNKSVTVSMIKITLTLMNDTFPDAKDLEHLQFIHRGKDFEAPMKMSYHCTRTQHFNFTSIIPENEFNGVLKAHDVQLEAFRDGKSTGFSTVHDCDSSETSDVVPIAVGIALVALILIVLISYLCARRRSNSRGYVSF